MMVFTKDGITHNNRLYSYIDDTHYKSFEGDTLSIEPDGSVILHCTSVDGQPIEICVNNMIRSTFEPIKVLEFASGKILIFPTVKDLADYSGHDVPNGYLNLLLDLEWFNKEYRVLKIN